MQTQIHTSGQALPAHYSLYRQLLPAADHSDEKTKYRWKYKYKYTHVAKPLLLITWCTASFSNPTIPFHAEGSPRHHHFAAFSALTHQTPRHSIQLLNFSAS